MMATKGKEPKLQMGSEGREAKDEEGKWVTHYSSRHQILLVGEGDFSFSSSLANAFGSASNICASSLDSYDALIKKYKNAKSNLENLEKLGASLLHGVDATKMRLHTDLANRKFDRIIFNFPHAGFYGKEDNAHMIQSVFLSEMDSNIILMHRELVQGFLGNAQGMLRYNGEIHVSHKSSAPFCRWNLEELASGTSLALIQCVDYNKDDYPGYRNKRGGGERCDEPFPLGESSTYKFGFRRRAKKVSKATTSLGSMRNKSRKVQNIPMQMQLQPTSSDFNYSQRHHIITHIPPHVALPSCIPERNYSYSGVFDGNLNGMVPTYRMNRYDHVPVSVPERMSSNFDANYHVRREMSLQGQNHDLPYLHCLYLKSRWRRVLAHANHTG